MQDCPPHTLGPLFGKWTPQQEEAADKVISYIIIDVKNRDGWSEQQIRFASDGCIPKSPQSKFLHKNFSCHATCNPYISVILNFGWEVDGPAVELYKPTTSSEIQNLQIPIIAYGLTSKTFKCLDKRPSVAHMMRLLRDMDRNPVRGLSEDHQMAAGVRDCLPLKCHPGREWSLTG